MPADHADVGFGKEMHATGKAEAAGMATGGGGISPPKRGFATRASARAAPAPHPRPAARGAGAPRRMSTPGGPHDSMHHPPPEPGWTPADRGETGQPSVGADDHKAFAVRPTSLQGSPGTRGAGRSGTSARRWQAHIDSHV
jgi:hypothetical protein